MEFNVFDLKKELEKTKGAEISWAEIGRRSGIHQNTLVNVSRNNTRRVDLETLERLLAFFQSEGLQVQIGDLFRTTTDT